MTYGGDSIVNIVFSPGDLLTFGAGVNAGKLVKVNANSFGPDVIVIGKVYKHLPNSGLLYFRQVSYKLSFGTSSSAVFALDAGLSASYPGSGTVWFDLSGNARNFTLINGPAYSSANSGLISFDGADDFARLTYTVTQSTSTLIFWFNSRSFSTATELDSIISNDNTGGSRGFDFRKVYYDTKEIGRARFEMMQHMFRKNIGLCFPKTCDGWLLPTIDIAEFHYSSSASNKYIILSSKSS
jgi:hypothetical protein